MLHLPAILLGILLATSSFAKDWGPCLPTLPKGSRCTEEILELRPTQPEVGRREVNQKTEKYRRKSKGQLEALVEEKPAPAIVGPDGRLYVIDRHHTLLSLHQAGVSRATVILIENWSALASGQPRETRMRKFWERMKREGHCWLETEHGEIVNPLAKDFPRKLTECGNNRMRSVVYELIEEGVLEKKPVHYHQFRVARELRLAGFHAKDGEVLETISQVKFFLTTDEGRRLVENVACRGNLSTPGSGDEDI